MKAVAVAALVLIAVFDLWLTTTRRINLATRLETALARLSRGNMQDFLERTIQGVRTASCRFFGPRILSIRFVIGSLVSSTLLAAAVLTATAQVLTVTMQEPIAQFLRYFVWVTMLCGWVGASATAAMLDASRRTRSLFVPFAAAPLHLLAACVLWLLVMHAGIWLEYQQIRTPLPYASEWFYADVYLRYMRDPGGRCLTLAVSAGVLWSFLIPWCALLVAVLARVLLRLFQPATRRLLGELQKLPRGLLTIAAIVLLVALVAT
jgi:hypothetical protein